MKINVSIQSGEGELQELPAIVSERNFKLPGIICDKNLYESVSYVAEVVQKMQQNGAYILFYDYPFEPSYQYLDELMEKLRADEFSDKIDLWIGIGGGSSLDVAKGLAILCKNEGPALNFRGFPKCIVEPLPVIAVPSTTGTGSEVVYNASFIDESSQVKMGINYEDNYPILAILDPKVVASAPKSVLSSSGCDALVHALESFVSVKANAHSRVFSAHSFKLIMQNMPILLEGKGTMDNWVNMQWAAVYAMLGLSNTTSGPTAALSYYLGTHFNVPHGVAGGVFIAKVSKHNHDSGYFDYADLYVDEGEPQAKTREEKSAYVVQQIEDLVNLANMPKSLSSLGVTANDYAGFKSFAIKAKEAFGYNPVGITEQILEDILQ